MLEIFNNTRRPVFLQTELVQFAVSQAGMSRPCPCKEAAQYEEGFHENLEDLVPLQKFLTPDLPTQPDKGPHILILAYVLERKCGRLCRGPGMVPQVKASRIPSTNA